MKLRINVTDQGIREITLPGVRTIQEAKQWLGDRFACAVIILEWIDGPQTIPTPKPDRESGSGAQA